MIFKGSEYAGVYLKKWCRQISFAFRHWHIADFGSDTELYKTMQTCLKNNGLNFYENPSNLSELQSNIKKFIPIILNKYAEKFGSWEYTPSYRWANEKNELNFYTDVLVYDENKETESLSADTLDDLLELMHKQFLLMLEDEKIDKEKKSERRLIEERKKSVRFKTDEFYYLVKDEDRVVEIRI